MTVEHLKKATRGLRQREPDLIDLWRLNVNHEQLMNQLEDLVDNDNVCSPFHASFVHMSLVLGREGAFYAFLAHLFISEGPRKWGLPGSKKPLGPGHEGTGHQAEKHL